MKTLLVIAVFMISSAKGLTQMETAPFTDFINNQPRKNCLSPLDSLAVEQLFRSNVIRVNNHNVTLNRLSASTISIDPFGLCNEYRTITYHYYQQGEREFMFVYKKYAVVREDYGELQLYEKKKEKWEFGRILTFSWKHFFSISQEEIDRLRNLDQYPNYLVTFRERGIEFSIPWEIYSFDQGSEINGYVQGNGSQPILLEYKDIIR